MRDKARQTFEEARLLCAAKKYNGAANRLYYALYQIIVTIFEEKGIKQASLTNKVDPENPGYWLHEVIRNNSTLAGVAWRDRRLIVELWRLRTRADYENQSIVAGDLDKIMPVAEKVLNDLGIVPR